VDEDEDDDGAPQGGEGRIDPRDSGAFDSTALLDPVPLRESGLG